MDSFISSKTLYEIQKGWAGLALYALQTNKQPAVFQALQSIVTAALGVARSSPPATAICDVESVALDLSNTVVKIADKLHASNHASYISIALPVLKQRSSKIARSLKKHRLNTAFASATTVVKKEDLWDVTKAAVVASCT